MLKSWQNLLILVYFSVASANYHGPYLLWGIEGLGATKKAALVQVDNKELQHFFSKAEAIIVFLKNATTRLSYENFPEFKEMISNYDYIYLPQDSLPSDPLDFNSNSEVINLIGDAVQQDVELTALYKDAVVNYGEGKVLGILASRWDYHQSHHLSKRQAGDSPPTTEGPPDKDSTLAYISERAILALKYPPTLSYPSEDGKEQMNLTLTEHAKAVTTDHTGNLFTIVIPFLIGRDKLVSRFRFTVKNGYWELQRVDLEPQKDDLPKVSLPLAGQNPKVPKEFSYRCMRSFVFKNGSTSLTLRDMQLQLWPKNKQFGDVYDCVGFFTAPILSGIFVTFIIAIAMAIAISAILDIKPPNRFENRSGKSLTFTVQE